MALATQATHTRPWWTDGVTLRRRRLVLSVLCLAAAALWEIGTVTGTKPIAVIGSVGFALSEIHYVVAIIYTNRLRVGLPLASPAAYIAQLGQFILAVWNRPASSRPSPVAKAVTSGLWLFVALLVLAGVFFVYIIVHVGVG